MYSDYEQIDCSRGILCTHVHVHNGCQHTTVVDMVRQWMHVLSATLTVRCIAITVRCIAITVRCIAITVRCIAITVWCIAITVQCIAITVQCIAITVQCMVDCTNAEIIIIIIQFMYPKDVALDSH